MKRLKVVSIIILCAMIFWMIGAADIFPAQADTVAWSTNESIFVSGGGDLYHTMQRFMILLTFLAAGLLLIVTAKEDNCNTYLRMLYEKLINDTDVGISITNSGGEYEYMNEGYRSMLFISDSNPLLKTPTDLVSGETAAVLGSIANSDTVGEADAAGAAAGAQFAEGSSGQFCLKEEDGSSRGDRYINYNHFAVYDRNEQKKNVNILNDVSEIEQMKQKLEEQLKEIQYYSNIKDIFLANISHEIKTPLNAIVGTTYFLKDTPLSPAQQDLVGKIENASDMLLTLVNDVLDFSKIKEKKIDLYSRAFSLADTLHSVEQLFLPQLEKKGLRWECEMDFEPNLCISLDRIRLIQVLTNLIGNACKFTDEGYVRLSVEDIFAGDGQVKLEFCVEDSGIGIAEADFPKLFNEFEQLENHLTKQHTGTGLGLAICKGIVEDMGGSIWVESELGAGSSFYFTVVAQKASAEEAAKESGGAAANDRSDGSGTRVLVVEDMEINREIAVNLLRSVNAEYETAENGMEAIRCCQKHDKDYYDIILMDIHMPEMDGYTASGILKNELNLETPIIALTATEVDNEIRLKYRDTISEFILKPFRVENFYGTLQKYFVSAKQETGERSVHAIPPAELRTGMEMETADPFSGKAEAIHNMGGTEEMYCKYVTKFQERNRGVMDELTGLLERGDEQEAYRLIHSIKGTAGMLGMRNLQEKASVLGDELAQENEEEIPRALTAFGEALSEVLCTEL